MAVCHFLIFLACRDLFWDLEQPPPSAFIDQAVVWCLHKNHTYRVASTPIGLILPTRVRSRPDHLKVCFCFAV